MMQGKERKKKKFDYLLLRCRTDGEGMPFEAGDGGDFDKDPVAGGKVEIMRPFDDQIGHFGGQDDPGDDGGFAFAHP